MYRIPPVDASELKSNIRNANLDKNKKKLFLNFDTSHVNLTNNFFKYIVSINKNLKKTDEMRFRFKVYHHGFIRDSRTKMFA